MHLIKEIMAIYNSDKLNITYSCIEDNITICTNDTISTRIIVEPLQTIGFYEAHFRLYYEIKGKLNVGKQTVEHIKLENQNTWIVGNKYTYDLTFRIPNTPISFSGSHLEIVWYLTIELDLDTSTKSDIRSDFLKNNRLLGLLKSYDGKIIEKRPLVIYRGNSFYVIENFNYSLDTTSNHYFFIGIIILSIDISLYLVNSYGFLSIIALLIGIAFLTYGGYKSLTVGLLDELKIKGEAITQGKFRVALSFKKNASKISSISFFYSINEEVVDQRGTSSTTYKETIYKSKEETLLTPFDNQIYKEILFDKGEFPTSFEYKTARLYWQLHVRFHFKNGLSYTVKRNLEVS